MYSAATCKAKMQTLLRGAARQYLVQFAEPMLYMIGLHQAMVDDEAAAALHSW
jgi:hypothetical protein